MNTEDFFEAIWRGKLSDLDIYNKAQVITDDFKEPKLSLLWDEYMNFLNKGASRSTYKNFEDWIPEDPFEYQFQQLGSLLSNHIKNKSPEQPVRSIPYLNWSDSDKTLWQLIESLKKHNLISNTDTDKIIREHFKEPQEQPEPINWLKSQRLLIYLLVQLQKREFIAHENEWQLYSKHFLIKGKAVRSASLKSEASNILAEQPKGYQQIDTILESIS